VKGGLLSCTCYNFSLQAIGIGGTFLSSKLFVTAETELTDSGNDDVTHFFPRRTGFEDQMKEVVS
jgi:hypothetical protein